MTGGSFDVPPLDGETVDQFIDQLPGVVTGIGGQMGVFGGGEDGAVTEDFLDFEQIDAGFDQMGGICMSKVVG
jgi:hypothetical protein